MVRLSGIYQRYSDVLGTTVEYDIPKQVRWKRGERGQILNDQWNYQSDLQPILVAYQWFNKWNVADSRL